jgi:proteasome accessory factor C
MTGRQSANDRARRLLVLLPLLAKGTETTLSALAADVGADASQVADDLMTLSMCGVPPYSPDTMLEIEIDGDAVRVWSEPPALDVPLRLSAGELGALVAALEACGYDAGHPVAAELRAALAEPDDEDLAALVRTRMGAPAPDTVLEVLAGAIAGSQAVEIGYFTASRGTTGTRVIEPHAIGNTDGAWYVSAWCRSADDTRLFRVDRIASAESTGETFEPPQVWEAPDPAPFRGTGLPHAVVAFEVGSDLDERDWPGATFEEADDGRVLARVPYGSAGWVARRVVARLGEARVLEPAGVQEAVVRTANTHLRGSS